VSYTVHVDVADVRASDDTLVALWDTALWDGADMWSGVLPAWRDITDRVVSINTDQGRGTVLEVVPPGTATVTVLNGDGWAVGAGRQTRTIETPVSVTWGGEPLTWDGEELMWGTVPVEIDAYDNIDPGNWLRVRVDGPDGEHILWTGQHRRSVPTYTPWNEPAAELVAVDPLARLGQVSLPARPIFGEGQTAAERIDVCLDETLWPDELRDLNPGGPVLMRTDLNGSMLDQAQKSAYAAGGHLFATREGLIAYRSADWLRTNPRSNTVQAVLSNTGAPGTLAATGIEAAGPDLDSIRNVANLGSAEYQGSNPITVTVLDQSSMSIYGPLTYNVTDLPSEDEDRLEALGQRVLNLRAWPRPRIETVTLSPLTSPDVAAFVAGARFGDLVAVDYQHPSGWGWTYGMHIHGISHQIVALGDDLQPASWTCTLRLDSAFIFEPADAWDSGTWDDALWAEIEIGA
jgi:hypothetical protein